MHSDVDSVLSQGSCSVDDSDSVLDMEFQF